MFDRLSRTPFRVSLQAAYLVMNVLSHARRIENVVGVLDLDDESISLANCLIRSIEESESTLVTELPLAIRFHYITEIGNRISASTKHELRDFDHARGTQVLDALRKLEVPIS